MDLMRGERLHIEAKPAQQSYFQWDSFELDEHHFTVATGPASIERTLGLKQSWSYDVVLHSPKLTKPLSLDPVIIIVEDP